MNAHYEYPAAPWPMVGAAALAAVLAIYAWHRRAAPAARALAVLAAVGVPWALGAALEVMARDAATSLFWFKFHSVWHLPAGAVGLWFALEYAGLRHSVPPRTVTLIGIPVLVLFLLMLTSDAHHFVWETFSPDRGGRIVPTPLGATALAFGLLVSLATVLVFLWLFVQSPLHRPGAGLCLAGQVVLRAGYAVETMVASPASHMDLTILLFPLTVAMNAVALFRYHDFQLIPVARSRILDQMREGMLVVNSAQQILDINPAGESMLRRPRSLVIGKRVSEVVPGCPCLAGPIGPGEEECEVQWPDEAGNPSHTYGVRRSPLVRDHADAGGLLLLSDVTRERRAQAEVVEHQRAVAALQERDRVARELHDGLGQVLAYVRMQAQASREFLQQRRFVEADGALRQLTANAQDAQHDIRDFILGARTGAQGTSDFLAALQQYIDRFNGAHDIRATLEVSPALRAEPLDTMVAAQLLRIVQEALTNVRKHARAHAVRVQLLMTGGCATAVVADDGIGFNPRLVDHTDALTFGLRFMQDRAREIGGSLNVHSSPGQGAAVVLTVPMRKDSDASAAG
jgi:signal transduction histidine kinase